jgi:hypothetical protein
LSSVKFVFVVDLGCAIGHCQVQKFEVSYFSEKSGKGRVEVDSEDSHFILGQKRLFEFFLGTGFDFFFPLQDLALLILIDGLGNGVVEFLDVFVFFSLGDRGSKFLDLLKWLLHSFVKTSAPG